MRARGCWCVAIAAFMVAILTASQPCPAQVMSSPAPPPLQIQRPGGFGADPDPVFAAKRLRALNADRQKSMVSAAERLLNLARQLDAEIASNPTGQLTPDEMRQAAEIEKLARAVKDKMAQSFVETPGFRPPPMTMGGPGSD
jgi:hypothetical protein